MRNIENAVFLCELTKYDVYVCKNKVLQFQPRMAKHACDVLYLSVESGLNLVSLSDFFKSLLEQCSILRSVSDI